MVEKNAWISASENERHEMTALGREYIRFLNRAKTERETISFLKEQAKEKDFADLKELGELKPGQRVFMEHKGKAAIAVIIGQRPFAEGFNIVASHTDTPRLDLKPAPLYESAGMALFKTHYYGGIKRIPVGFPTLVHAWDSRKKSGQKIEIAIGEDDNDPVFTITDLLIHLAKDQMEKKMSEGLAARISISWWEACHWNRPKDKIKEAVKRSLRKNMISRMRISPAPRFRWYQR